MLIRVSMRISTICMCYEFFALSDSLDVVCYLGIKQTTVCNYYDRVKQRCIKSLSPNSIHSVRTNIYKLESQPC